MQINEAHRSKIDLKIISMVSKGLPWRQMTDSAPCRSLQKLNTSPSNNSDTQVFLICLVSV